MPVAAITGAYGYLGSRIRRRIDAAGWSTIALVRAPRSGDQAISWTLEGGGPIDELGQVDALVHCAYDFRPRNRAEIWRINVAGTSRLLAEAEKEGVSRILVLSSMSAYTGTHQLYGQAKLAIEQDTIARGGIAVRPGLVYGTDSHGGMSGALSRLTVLPIVPVIGGAARQFPVHEDDLADAILRILERDEWMPEVICIAQPESVTFRQLLRFLSDNRRRRRVFVTVPWQAVYAGLRMLEAGRIPLGFRSDSILGLARPAPEVPASAAFPGLLEGLRRLDERD